MTMQADYEEYELEYEDETGIPASECDGNDFQRWFEDTLLGKELAKIRTLLEELSKEKNLQQRLNSQANAHSAQSPKELIEAIQNYEVLKALHILQSGQIEKKHIDKDLLEVCDKAMDALIDVIVEDSKGGKGIGKGIKGAFSRFIKVDYNSQGYKDYSGEVRKQLKKGSVYKLREVLESITKGKSIESALHNSVFYDKKGNFKSKHKELSFIPLNTFELKVLVEIEEVNLGQIDLSYIKSLAEIFMNYSFEIFHWRTNRKDFSGIEQWDTSKINNMCKLFAGVKDFKADLSKWNPKKAEDIAFMFSGAKSFTSNLDAWNLSQGVVENAKYLFENCPLSQTPPSWYKAVFDMDNPSVALLYKLVKIRDYTRAKECLLKLQTLSKEEYIECARLCFYLPRGVVGTALPDKDFFTALVNQAKSQNIHIPISNEVMQKCLRYGELEYAKYLVTLGYKVTIDKENNFGVYVALKSGPTQKVRDILHFFVENLGNEINEEFFEAIFGDSPGFVRDSKQETLDIFFKEFLSYYPRETFTNKKVLSCLINVGLIRILFKNGIEVDLQGVAYNPRVIKHYLDEDLQTFLKLLELHLLQADSIIEYYIYYPRDTFVKVSVLLVFVDEFKNKLMRMPMQAILKQFAKNGFDVEKLGTYEGKNLYEILEDSEHKEEILSLLKIK